MNKNEVQEGCRQQDAQNRIGIGTHLRILCPWRPQHRAGGRNDAGASGQASVSWDRDRHRITQAWRDIDVPSQVLNLPCVWLFHTARARPIGVQLVLPLHR